MVIDANKDATNMEFLIVFFFVLFQKRIKEKKIMKSIVDHEGRKFRSIVELCEFNNIGYRVLLRRLERGLSMEEALTLPVVERAKHAKMSDKEYAKEYHQRNRDKILAYQAEYREKNRDILAEKSSKKRAEKRLEEKVKRETDMLTEWYKLRSAIDSNFDNLNLEEFERLNFEDMLIAIDDIQLGNFVAKNPFLWQRGNEYLKQKKQEVVYQKFFVNEIDD